MKQNQKERNKKKKKKKRKGQIGDHKILKGSLRK